MEIKSLNNLPKNNGVYDLYTTVLINSNLYSVYTFTLTERHNMRIDLVCYDLYQNTDNIDILTNLNGIYNPFMIQSGMDIYFVSIDEIDDVRSNENLSNSIINLVQNANKGKSLNYDKNRQNDIKNRSTIEKNKSYIPTNILTDQNNVIQIKDNKIILKPNL